VEAQPRTCRLIEDLYVRHTRDIAGKAVFGADVLRFIRDLRETGEILGCPPEIRPRDKPGFCRRLGEAMEALLRSAEARGITDFRRFSTEIYWLNRVKKEVCEE